MTRTEIEYLIYDNEEYRLENDALAKALKDSTDKNIRCVRALNRSRIVCVLLGLLSIATFFIGKKRWNVQAD